MLVTKLDVSWLVNMFSIEQVVFFEQEIVPLRKVCRRPETEYRLAGRTVGDLSAIQESTTVFGASPMPMSIEDKVLTVDPNTSQQVDTT